MLERGRTYCSHLKSSASKQEGDHTLNYTHVSNVYIFIINVTKKKKDPFHPGDPRGRGRKSTEIVQASFLSLVPFCFHSTDSPPTVNKKSQNSIFEA